jgi:hypothetical protein
LQAIASGAHGLDDLSGERIWSELCRILCTPGGYRQSRAMRDTGVSSRIGLPIDPDDPCDSTRVCAAAAANGAMCAIVIGFALAGKPVTEVRYVQERWRLSRADRELMEMATTLAAWETRPLTDFMLLATRCERHVPPLASILRAFGRDSDADILRRGSPQFPVRGEDLVRLGFPPGKEVGRTLASLRKRWELSGFKDDREQLLEAVSMAPPAAPRI